MARWQGPLRGGPGRGRRGDRPATRHGRIRRNTRAFLGRTVRFLAGEQGVRQFLDLGTGIPAASNTHEVAQHIAPLRPLSPVRPMRHVFFRIPPGSVKIMKDCVVMKPFSAGAPKTLPDHAKALVSRPTQSF
ncbi:MAG TPA: SAM-dependent methyltransferase [Trebonia sp.]